MSTRELSYQEKLAVESKKWGEHLKQEATGEWFAWIDHPVIFKHYLDRCAIDGQRWESWVATYLGGPARVSMDLGCGAGAKSRVVYDLGGSQRVEGIDLSEDRINEGERARIARGTPGNFRVQDMNTTALEKNHYDLIFSAHSFHHFLELELVMEQVHEALTPNGLFVLEEFVGPTQFQWTDKQIEITKFLTQSIPERFRKLRWGAIKPYEGRPTVAEVVAASPFESIRSAEIVPLFERYFDVVHVRKLGGTIQHLLYNGIAHNFRPEDPEALRYIKAIYEIEDSMIDSEILPSDFQLLVGKRRSG